MAKVAMSSSEEAISKSLRRRKTRLGASSMLSKSSEHRQLPLGCSASRAWGYI